MNAQEKKYIRSIIRQVHPDLFVLHPLERQKNSECLKVCDAAPSLPCARLAGASSHLTRPHPDPASRQALNSYVEGLATGAVPRSTTLEFWVKDDDDGLRKVTALLPASGYLGELFHAFGLITKEELENEAARSQAADVNFLQWLQSTVQEAVFVGQQHDDLKQRIREKRTMIEHSYGLASLVVRCAPLPGCPARRSPAYAARCCMPRPPLAARGCRRHPAVRAHPRRWLPPPLPLPPRPLSPLPRLARPCPCPRAPSPPCPALPAPPPRRRACTRLQVEPEYAMRVEDQKRQLEALSILDTCLAAVEAAQLAAYEGLSVHLHHPEVAPAGSYGFMQADEQRYSYRSSRMASFVAEDGVLHLVAHRASLAAGLQELDTEKARLLSQVRRRRRRSRPLLMGTAAAQLLPGLLLWSPRPGPAAPGTGQAYPARAPSTPTHAGWLLHCFCILAPLGSEPRPGGSWMMRHRIILASPSLLAGASKLSAPPRPAPAAAGTTGEAVLAAAR
jgi:hypothetical protein